MYDHTVSTKIGLTNSTMWEHTISTKLLADCILGRLRWYRRLRGGKWEHESACCACPVDAWRAVEVFHPMAWPRVTEREDYR